MENKDQTRASQTNKSDSTKVETRAAEVKPVEQKKVWTPPSYLDTPNAPNGFRHRWVRVEILRVRRHEKHTRTLKVWL